MNNKLVIRVLFVLIILSLIVGNIYVYASGTSGFGNGFDSSIVPGQNTSNDKLNNVNNAFGKVFNSVILILQVLSVGGIVFAGVRLMFASNAATRADMLESMKFLIIGMVIVFGASSIIKFIVNAATDVMG